MWPIILIVTFTGISFLGVVILRSFESMSLRELKRQARFGNLQAAKVYAVRGAYDPELWLLTWLIIGLLSAAVVVLLDDLLWWWLALITAAVLIVTSRLILPRLKKPAVSLALAATVSPIFGVVLRFTHPILQFPGRWVRRITEGDPFITIHSKDELLEMLRHTPDNQNLSRDELRIASSALVFGDKTIGEIMTPISSVRSISVDTVLSPVELGDLHDSGFSRFPVYEGKNHFIGTLFLKDAVELRSNKPVRDLMRKGAYYVSEMGSLEQALKAFLKTHHHLFLVVNEFEEVVGLISIEDVLEQIIGAKIVDEFDQYDDLRAVATQRARDIRESRGDQTVVE